MKIINSRGRVLLEVKSAEYGRRNLLTGEKTILYSYRGDGCGGFSDEVNLMRTIDCIKMDSKSAKVVGELPIPVESME